MPIDDSKQPQLATNDQLAALYLRDRDTPCPSCNYNRRDGTTSTCPECNQSFTLVSIGSLEHTRYIRLAKSILLITGLYVLTGLIRSLIQIQFILRITNGSVAITNQTSYIIIWVINLFTLTTVLVLTLVYWCQKGRDQKLSIVKIILPMGIITTHAVILFIYGLLSPFF